MFCGSIRCFVGKYHDTVLSINIALFFNSLKSIILIIIQCILSQFLKWESEMINDIPNFPLIFCMRMEEDDYGWKIGKLIINTSVLFNSLVTSSKAGGSSFKYRHLKILNNLRSVRGAINKGNKGCSKWHFSKFTNSQVLGETFLPCNIQVFGVLVNTASSGFHFSSLLSNPLPSIKDRFHLKGHSELNRHRKI